jgi:hypothetical protein
MHSDAIDQSKIQSTWTPENSNRASQIQSIYPKIKAFINP